MSQAVLDAVIARLTEDTAFMVLNTFVTTDQPDPLSSLHRGMFELRNTKPRLKAGTVVYLGPEVPFDSYRTAWTVVLAFYAPQNDLRRTLAMRDRAKVLLRTQIIGGYFVQWTAAQAGPVQDRGYDPPEWYSSARVMAHATEA